MGIILNDEEEENPMSQIPTSVTEEQFIDHIRPHLSVAKRGYECKIDLYKVFNYILYRLYTGCQWEMLPIEHDEQHPEKKKSVGKRFTITGRNGMRLAVLKLSGSIASAAFTMSLIVAI